MCLSEVSVPYSRQIALWAHTCGKATLLLPEKRILRLCLPLLQQTLPHTPQDRRHRPAYDTDNPLVQSINHQVYEGCERPLKSDSRPCFL